MHPSSRLYSLLPTTAGPGERPGARISGAPFSSETRRLADATAALGRREPVSSRTASGGASELRACALSPSPRRPWGRVRAAFAAPGPWDARLAGPCQLQVREEDFKNPGVRWSDPPRERSGLPRSLQGARGPRTGAPRPQLLCFSHFPAFWLQLMGSGNLWEELQKTILSPAVGRITCGIFPPLCGQSSFHPCLYFPGVGFCSLWTLARLLGAYWLWAIRARASCQGLCPVQSLLEEEVRVQGQERGPGEVGQKKLQRGKGCDKCRQRLFRNWKFSNFLSVLVFLVHLLLWYPHLVLMVLLRLENQQAFGLEVSLEFFEISFHSFITECILL